jgi:hypothetical protein
VGGGEEAAGGGGGGWIWVGEEGIWLGETREPRGLFCFGCLGGSCFSFSFEFELKFHFRARPRLKFSGFGRATDRSPSTSFADWSTAICHGSTPLHPTLTVRSIKSNGRKSFRFNFGLAGFSRGGTYFYTRIFFFAWPWGGVQAVESLIIISCKIHGLGS